MRKVTTLLQLILAITLLFTVLGCPSPHQPDPIPTTPTDPTDPTTPAGTATLIVKNSTLSAIKVGMMIQTTSSSYNFPSESKIIEVGASASFTVTASKATYPVYASPSATSWSTFGLSGDSVGFSVPKDQTYVLVIFKASISSYSYTDFAYGIRDGETDRCFPPTFSPGSGEYTIPQTVILDSASTKSGANYFSYIDYIYTVDGTVPSSGTDGTFTTNNSLPVEGDITICAIARHKNGLLADSLPVTSHYSTPNTNVPGYLQNITISDNTKGSEVTLTWTDPADYDFDHVIISYPEGASINVAKGIESVTISGLQEKTEYRFTLTPYDTSGNAGYSDTEWVKTPDLTPPSATVTSNVSEYTNLTYFWVKLALSETVTGFEQSDVNLSGCTLDQFYFDRNTNTVTIRIFASNAVGTLGALSLTVPAGSFVDKASLPNAEITWSAQCFNANMGLLRNTCPGIDANLAYAIDYTNSRLVEYQIDKKAVMAMYDLGGVPTSMKKCGNILYIVMNDSSLLRRFDLNAKSFIGSFTAPSSRYIRDIIIDEPRERMLILSRESDDWGYDSFAQFISIADGTLLSSTSPVVHGTTGIIAKDGSFVILVQGGISPMTLYRHAVSGANVNATGTSSRKGEGYYHPFVLSPDGASIVCHYYPKECLDLFSTDSTMALTRTITGLERVSGTTFSSDGTKLYATHYGISSTRNGQVAILNVNDYASPFFISIPRCTIDGDIVYPCLNSNETSLIAIDSNLNNDFITSVTLP